MNELFTKYTKAFSSFDAEAISKLYRLPCAISDADGIQTFTDRSQLKDKFLGNCASMRDIGFKKAQFKILESKELSKQQQVLTIAWCVDTNQSSIEFRALYICHKIDASWYIFSANVYPGTY